MSPSACPPRCFCIQQRRRGAPPRRQGGLRQSPASRHSAGECAGSGRAMPCPESCRAPSCGMSQAGGRAAPSQQTQQTNKPKKQQASCSAGEKGLAGTRTRAGMARGFTGGGEDLSIIFPCPFPLAAQQRWDGPVHLCSPIGLRKRAALITWRLHPGPSGCPALSSRALVFGAAKRASLRSPGRRAGHRATRAALARGDAGGGVAVPWLRPCPRRVLLLGLGSS